MTSAICIVNLPIFKKNNNNFKIVPMKSLYDFLVFDICETKGY